FRSSVDVFGESVDEAHALHTSETRRVLGPPVAVHRRGGRRRGRGRPGTAAAITAAAPAAENAGGMTRLTRMVAQGTREGGRGKGRLTGRPSEGAAQPDGRVDGGGRGGAPPTPTPISGRPAPQTRSPTGAPARSAARPDV